MPFDFEFKIEGRGKLALHRPLFPTAAVLFLSALAAMGVFVNRPSIYRWLQQQAKGAAATCPTDPAHRHEEDGSG